jgi:glutathione S-transferase
MVVIHHLNNSRSQRVVWLAEELGVDYQIKRYERAPIAAPAELAKVHPLGKSPVITDGDAVIAETGAIVEYLIGHYGQGRLIPTSNTPERLKYTYWLHYAEGSAMTPLLLQLFVGQLGAAGAPVVEFARGQGKLHFDFVESQLNGCEWFAGAQLTGADVMMSFPLEILEAQGALKSYPNIAAFLTRIHARPAYRRALERGGAYTMKF